MSSGRSSGLSLPIFLPEGRGQKGFPVQSLTQNLANLLKDISENSKIPYSTGPKDSGLLRIEGKG